MKSLVFLFTLISSTSYADVRLSAKERPLVRSDLEKRVIYLESQTDELQRRLNRIEDFLDGRPHPNPRDEKSICMVVDSGYSKTFLGSGRSKLDAEYAARESCQKSVHSSYCSGNALLKCDSTRDDLYSRGHVCIVVDSGYGKTFRGEGETPIEAEAKAKQACQSNVHASYCGKVAARCDSY